MENLMKKKLALQLELLSRFPIDFHISHQSKWNFWSKSCDKIPFVQFHLQFSHGFRHLREFSNELCMFFFIAVTTSTKHLPLMRLWCGKLLSIIYLNIVQLFRMADFWSVLVFSVFVLATVPLRVCRDLQTRQ